MSLKSVKISEARQLKQEDVRLSSAVLIPVAQVKGDGILVEEPRTLSYATLSNLLLQTVEASGDVVLVSDLQENYLTKQETTSLIRSVEERLEIVEPVVELLVADKQTEGSVKYQINELKEDLIGTEEDHSSADTINAAKNLVAESLQFIKYNS